MVVRTRGGGGGGGEEEEHLGGVPAAEVLYVELLAGLGPAAHYEGARLGRCMNECLCRRRRQNGTMVGTVL